MSGPTEVYRLKTVEPSGNEASATRTPSFSLRTRLLLTRRLIQIFRANGITGWRRGCVIRGRKTEDRRQEKQFSVRPDFVFLKLKTAIFVDGCFWHGCPRHATWPRTRAAFWRRKIEGNRARDRRVNYALRKRGWKVARVWEHELRRRDEPKLIRRLKKYV
jgi:DNA mismatch endonuclease (patch repair protein)